MLCQNRAHAVCGSTGTSIRDKVPVSCHRHHRNRHRPTHHHGSGHRERHFQQQRLVGSRAQWRHDENNVCSNDFQQSSSDETGPAAVCSQVLCKVHHNSRLRVRSNHQGLLSVTQRSGPCRAKLIYALNSMYEGFGGASLALIDRRCENAQWPRIGMNNCELLSWFGSGPRLSPAAGQCVYVGPGKDCSVDRSTNQFRTGL